MRKIFLNRDICILFCNLAYMVNEELVQFRRNSKISSAETDGNDTPKSRSGRKLTPTRQPAFIYEMEEKVRQARERRKTRALTASVGKKVVERASDSDGRENIDSHRSMRSSFG